MTFNYEEYRANKIKEGIYHMNKGKKKCSVCKYYLCTCQLGLLDWIEVKQVFKNPTHNEKIKYCPHKCINHGIKCLDCYNFDKFKMVVKL